ncbi:phage tail protein [Achromobacter deleyi]|uniref:phage tail protein n=1 Tax=Achromobacter deleyi TaxID=1353891 RepID=UPI001467B738|nr:phage tail protein [Achromobacter deleyi]CAB3870070.1 hypothetical protein LMG3412_02707 [Achromobacter deleyi]
MQELEHIEVGQQANDGTGDPLRDGMVKVNANFAKVQTGVDAVESTAINAAQRATEAKITADGAIPATQKGMAGGIAPLDASGKVPSAHLEAYALADEKGAAGGLAPLDASAKVPMANLPAGTAGGLAPLGTDGKVPAANLPAAENSIPLSQKGQPNGVPTLDSGGKVPTGQLPPIPTGPPAGSVAWWPLRSSIPAGQIPADGQTISRATYPDLAAMVMGGKVPVVSEADWLADPLKRGSYTVGDGSTTIRLPDLNGKAAGSLGAVFIRGDGARTSGVAGSIANDTNRSHSHSLGVYGPTAGNSASFASGGGTAIATYFTAANGGDESKPLSAHGTWTIQAFGAVTNPGSADAAQLASDLASLGATLQNDVAFTIIYPNGGTAASPAPVSPNSRYVMANPFLGSHVICVAQIRFSDGWCETGWYSDFVGSASRAVGTKATQLGDSIVVTTGVSDIASPWNLTGTGATGARVNPVQSRVLVWKSKGGVL